MRQDVDVIYSKITIDEIGQILDKAQDKGAEYFYEHYYVLVHISELPDSDAGVVPDTFAMRFSRV